MSQPLMTLKLSLKVKSQSKNEKYAIGNLRTRVRLIGRGGLKEMEIRIIILCECGTNETEMHVFVR